MAQAERLAGRVARALFRTGLHGRERPEVRGVRDRVDRTGCSAVDHVLPRGILQQRSVRVGRDDIEGSRGARRGVAGRVARVELPGVQPVRYQHTRHGGRRPVLLDG